MLANDENARAQLFYIFRIECAHTHSANERDVLVVVVVVVDAVFVVAA